MSADPPRRRRSSFTEQFQRVFQGDRADRTDKKRQSLGPDTLQPRVSARPSNEYADSKSTATVVPSVPDDTDFSSFNFSSDSHIPSVSTTGSGASVRAIPRYEDVTPQMTAGEKHTPERGRIVSEPTGKKDLSRKERRATKRLEAERKEAEKRMLKLEQSQAQVDDRTGRRLRRRESKGNSERSSSAGSLRLRSSSIKAFFTGSRQSSRSRAGSESDNESARGSADINPAAPIPPSIPLALEERFGANVSRELATRHGTTLVPASQLSSSQPPSQSPQQTQRLHHTPVKSDDLRENWKTAEEWQKTQGGRESGGALAQPKHMAEGRSQSPRVSLYGTDLDQDLFTATSRHGRKTSSTINDGSSKDSPDTQITTVQQLREVSRTASEGKPPSYSATGIQPPIFADVSKNPMRHRLESTPQTHPRVYKSSPLAMNPNSPDSPTRSSNTDPTLCKDNLDLPKPLRVSKTPQLEEPQGRTRQSIPASEQVLSSLKATNPSGTQESANGVLAFSGKENRQDTGRQERQISDDSRQPHAIPPPKHPGRLSLDEHMPKRASNQSSAGKSAPAEVAQHGTKETHLHHLSPRRNTDGRKSPPIPVGWNDTDNRRASFSSQASSYNTADEEVLDVPGRSKRASAPALKSKEAATEPELTPNPKPKPKPITPATEVVSVPQKGNPKSPSTNSRTKPPLASGPLNPIQKMKLPRSDEVLTKLFVICCQCKYWHDMPSDVYAKLTSPERASSGSLLSRTFSRGKSLRNSIFSSDSDDPRRMPVPRRGPQQQQQQQDRGSSGSGGGNGIGNHGLAARSSAPPPSQQIPARRHQCCWCAHNMSKSCCQGWTALVHMRERYH
ncbi:hypothetical protein N7454_006674 [Penicillium verhagenii]|nr:hypothetical protein N7454_006674 [Penicillium verhagenii]